MKKAGSKTESSRKKEITLSSFYHRLPEEARARIRDLLTSGEWSRLLKSSRVIGNREFSRLPALPNPLPALWSSLQLILLLISVITQEWERAAGFLLYAFFGFTILRSAGMRYWLFRLIPRPEWNFFALTLLFFAAMYPLVASLSLQVPRGEPDWILIAQACFFGPVFEELLFREYLFRLMARFSARGDLEIYLMSILFPSILFALVHLEWGPAADWRQFFIYFSSGLLLALLRWFTRSLFFPMLDHIAVNSMIMLL